MAEFRYKSAIFCALGWFPPALDGERRAELKAGGPWHLCFPFVEVNHAYEGRTPRFHSSQGVSLTESTKCSYTVGDRWF